jgi:1-acyl-sn-glycerol-3-phosphate acyltransferase
MFLKKVDIFQKINKLITSPESLHKECKLLLKYLFDLYIIKYINFTELSLLKKTYQDQGFIIFMNHTSIVADYLLIQSKINNYTVTLQGLFKKLLYFSEYSDKQMAIRCQLIEYERDNSNKKKISGIQVKKKILQKIKEKQNVVIYPEGTMTPKKNLKKFKKGSIYLSYENNIPILPIIVDYKDDYYINNDSELNRLEHHLSDQKGIDVHMLKFIYPENFDNFDSYYHNIYRNMNDFYIKIKNK